MRPCDYECAWPSTPDGELIEIETLPAWAGESARSPLEILLQREAEHYGFNDVAEYLSYCKQPKH